MTDWQDISSAPKDECAPLILLCDRDKTCVTGFWGDDENTWVTDYRGKGNAQWIAFPTHWQPLPPPPKETP